MAEDKLFNIRLDESLIIDSDFKEVRTELISLFNDEHRRKQYGYFDPNVNNYFTFPFDKLFILKNNQLLTIKPGDKPDNLAEFNLTVKKTTVTPSESFIAWINSYTTNIDIHKIEWVDLQKVALTLKSNADVVVKTSHEAIKEKLQNKPDTDPQLTFEDIFNQIYNDVNTSPEKTAAGYHVTKEIASDDGLYTIKGVKASAQNNQAASELLQFNLANKQAHAKLSTDDTGFNELLVNKLLQGVVGMLILNEKQLKKGAIHLVFDIKNCATHCKSELKTSITNRARQILKDHNRVDDIRLAFDKGDNIPVVVNTETNCIKNNELDEKPMFNSIKCS